MWLRLQESWLPRYSYEKVKEPRGVGTVGRILVVSFLHVREAEVAEVVHKSNKKFWSFKFQLTLSDVT